MKKTDIIIRDSIIKNLQKIKDDSFTERIVRMHLSKKKNAVYKPFLNFGSMIIGISLVIISIGMIFFIRTKNVLVEPFDFNEQHGLILLLVSLIFLIYNWIENFTAPHKLFN